MRFRGAALLTATIAALAASLSFPAPVHAGERLDRIVAEKRIRLGVRADAPPFAAIRDGKVSGFSVDLCRQVAAAAMAATGLDALDADFVTVETQNRFKAIEEGRIDILCGAATATLKRREIVSFSLPIFSTGVSAVVAADAPDLLKEILVTVGPAASSEAAIAEAFRGRTVGVRANTTAAEWLSHGPLARLDAVTIREVGDHAAGLAAVAAGEMAAYFADKAILLGVLRQSPPAGGRLLVSEASFTREPYALALPRTDEDLRLMVDRALSRLYRDGSILKLYERHFGKPTGEVVLFYTMIALP
ncbi:MAG: transporter substrate-binding domain-containing protein, partial [Alphaproteobacteria bacterium]